MAGGEASEASGLLSELLAVPGTGELRASFSRALCAGVLASSGTTHAAPRKRLATGEFSCRTERGGPWSAVSIVQWEGELPAGPFTALVLVFSPASAEMLIEGNLALGSPNRISSGREPVTLETDLVVFTVPENQGARAGRIRPDPAGNRRLYGKPTSHELLLQGRIVPVRSSAQLLESLTRLSRPGAGNAGERSEEEERNGKE